MHSLCLPAHPLLKLPGFSQYPLTLQARHLSSRVTGPHCPKGSRGGCLLPPSAPASTWVFT